MDPLADTYLRDIGFRTMILIDDGQTASIAEVHEKIQSGQIIEWLSELGADMSILLSGKMDDAKDLTIKELQEVSTGFKGRERRKMGIENNGLCLLVNFVFQALLKTAPDAEPTLTWEFAEPPKYPH